MMHLLSIIEPQEGNGGESQIRFSKVFTDGNAIALADQRSRRTAKELLKLVGMITERVPDVLITHGMLEGADAIRRLKILGGASEG